MAKKPIPKIVNCTSIFLLRNVHTGAAVCIGYTTKTPLPIPECDVIHFCWLGKEAVKKLTTKNICYPHHRISCTPDEAEKIGVNFIRAATLQQEKK